MFKCPNCSAPLTVREKLNFTPDKPVICKKCSQKLLPFKLYYFGTFFVAAFGTSFLINYCEFNALSASGIALVCSFLFYICQPIRKV
ncbi:hypothetical protein C9980_15445 [Vibrio mediterranei]|nr:hypothetical protein C9980_15445 [Vibrio mediterranei]